MISNNPIQIIEKCLNTSYTSHMISDKFGRNLTANGIIAELEKYGFEITEMVVEQKDKVYECFNCFRDVKKNERCKGCNTFFSESDGEWQDYKNNKINYLTDCFDSFKRSI